MASQTVLVAKTNRRSRRLFRDYLQHARFAVVMTADGVEGVTLTRQCTADLVLLDLGLLEADLVGCVPLAPFPVTVALMLLGRRIIPHRERHGPAVHVSCRYLLATT